jgi:hypothetical protein
LKIRIDKIIFPNQHASQDKKLQKVNDFAPDIASVG